jgi:hypothetical protein
MSKTVLQKLGFGPNMSGLAVARPPELLDVINLPTAATSTTDLIVAFVRAIADVRPRLDESLPYYTRGGRLWFAYPKKTGSIPTDITRDRGWEPMAAHDLLPVTQVAIDDTWSALRFRYRDEIAKLMRKS